MKRDDNGLDEMQKAHRDKIGSQSFMLIFYLLMLDAVLYGVGIRWLAYPTNIMVIGMICLSVYLIRLIMANAYLPAKAKNSRMVVPLAVSIVIGCSISAVLLFSKLPIPTATANTEDNSALVLFIVSATGLLIVFAAMIIKQVRSKNDKDE